MEQARAQFLRDKEIDAIATSPMGSQLSELRAKLKELGGEFVLLPLIEEDIDAILSRGEMFKGSDAKLVSGSRNECHNNIRGLWKANEDNIKIVTGYALSDDAVWRQHTWGFDGDQMIETTTEREVYFGFILTSTEAQRFYNL